MNFDYKNILIMGYGKSGIAVEEILKKIDCNYKIYDSGKKITGGNYYYKLNRKIISQFDLIVVSPGISIFNKYIVMAERMGIKVVGEMEFGYWFTSSPVIAITGTNGKTTTTSLVRDIVKSTFSCGAFGNIGTPLSVGYNQKLDYLICEVSSFQLETTYSFNPYISVILNIAEDHLDRHKNFENYINCKIGLLKNCSDKSLVVLNADDKVIMSRTENIKAKKFFISKFNKVKGVYIKSDKIYVNLNGKPKEFMKVDDISQFGGIIEDILASILVGCLLKIDDEKILNAILNFEVSSHRLQVVANKKGVKYIDDSKSTNVHSSVNAIKCTTGNLVLLLGGEDKNLNFDEIFTKFSDRLGMVVGFGSSRKKILKSANKSSYEKIKIFKTFYEAVKFACSYAKENDVVLLSPACTSFDEFSSYAERGEVFEKLVKEFVYAKN
ncbi:MAG: UDP-N-acetylmuramoyl-L-alanine--D-glutamate ligase [Clostridiales bacterium]|nr:UDP-N-acetylmuramoyl-L-alanine--D-glutamate ligase [Clostridiales bacterium]